MTTPLHDGDLVAGRQQSMVLRQVARSVVQQARITQARSSAVRAHCDGWTTLPGGEFRDRSARLSGRPCGSHRMVVL
jgi:hypothetical protein